MMRSTTALRFVLMAIACVGWTACGDDDTEPDAGSDGGSKDAGASGAGGKGGNDAGMHDAAPAPDAGPAPNHDAGHDAGDQDDGGSAPIADFYPLTDGSRWVYRHSGGTAWDEEVELSTTDKHEGRAAFLLADTPGPGGSHGKAILVRDGGRVLRVHIDEYDGDDLETSTDYDPGFVRYSDAWARAKVGYSETLSYSRVEHDALGEITADGNRSHTYTVESRSAKVSVPAGDFDDCLQVLRSRVRMPGASAGEGDEDMFWFCPGIGKVRELDQVTGEAEELVSCDVPDGECP